MHHVPSLCADSDDLFLNANPNRKFYKSTPTLTTTSADSGDSLLDANFERDVADKACMNLYNDELFIK